MITLGVHEEITAASPYSISVLAMTPGEANPYIGPAWTNQLGLSTPAQSPSPNPTFKIYPGRMYMLETGSNSWTWADVQFNVPPGYTMYLGSLYVPMNPRTSFLALSDETSGTWQESFYVLPSDGAKWLAPGYSAGPRVDDVNWSISAGQLASGILAGSLNWRGTSITSALLSAQSLTFSSSASTINLNSNWSSYFTSGPLQGYLYPSSTPDQVAIYSAPDGSPKFISTNQIEISIVEITGGGFYVSFYAPGTPIELTNNDPTQAWNFYNNWTASYLVNSANSPFSGSIQPKIRS